MDISTVTQWLPYELLAVGVFFVLATGIALRSGAGKLVSLFLAFLIIPLLLTLLPKTWLIGGFINTIPATITAAVLIALVFILVTRMTPDAYNEGGRPLEALLAGVATTIGVIALWAQTPLENVLPTPTLLLPWFGSEFALLWIIASLVLLGLARRNARWL